MEEQEKAFVLDYGTDGTPLKVTSESPYPMIARALVYNMIKNRLEVDEREAFAFDAVSLVSFTYIAGNWRAVMTCDTPESKYYLVTYDSEKERACIETYAMSEQTEVYVPARRGNK